MKSRKQLNKDAVELRKKLGFNATAPLDLLNVVLEEYPNITIIFHPISKNTSGICINKNNIQIICINSDMNLSRRRFTLAHELYHLLIEKSFKLFVCNDNNESDSEKEANIFASFLLMPDEALKTYIKKNNITQLNLDNIINLEQYFQIGHHAMLIRLKQDNHITEVELQEYMNKSIMHESANRGFSTELYATPQESEYKVLGKYIKLVNELAQKDLISLGEQQELLSDAFRLDLIYNMDDGDSDE